MKNEKNKKSPTPNPSPKERGTYSAKEKLIKAQLLADENEQYIEDLRTMIEILDAKRRVAQEILLRRSPSLNPSPKGRDLADARCIDHFDKLSDQNPEL